jgi:hypothetical protein
MHLADATPSQVIFLSFFARLLKQANMAQNNIREFFTPNFLTGVAPCPD